MRTKGSSSKSRGGGSSHKRGLCRPVPLLLGLAGAVFLSTPWLVPVHHHELETSTEAAPATIDAPLRWLKTEEDAAAAVQPRVTTRAVPQKPSAVASSAAYEDLTPEGELDALARELAPHVSLDPEERTSRQTSLARRRAKAARISEAQKAEDARMAALVVQRRSAGEDPCHNNVFIVHWTHVPKAGGTAFASLAKRTACAKNPELAASNPCCVRDVCVAEGSCHSTASTCPFVQGIGKHTSNMGRLDVVPCCGREWYLSTVTSFLRYALRPAPTDKEIAKFGLVCASSAPRPRRRVLRARRVAGTTRTSSSSRSARARSRRSSRAASQRRPATAGTRSSRCARARTGPGTSRSASSSSRERASPGTAPRPSECGASPPGPHPAPQARSQEAAHREEHGERRKERHRARPPQRLSADRRALRAAREHDVRVARPPLPAARRAEHAGTPLRGERGRARDRREAPRVLPRAPPASSPRRRPPPRKKQKPRRNRAAGAAPTR